MACSSSMILVAREWSAGHGGGRDGQSAGFGWVVCWAWHRWPSAHLTHRQCQYCKLQLTGATTRHRPCQVRWSDHLDAALLDHQVKSLRGASCWEGYIMLWNMTSRTFHIILHSTRRDSFVNQREKSVKLRPIYESWVTTRATARDVNASKKC